MKKETLEDVLAIAQFGLAVMGLALAIVRLVKVIRN